MAARPIDMPAQISRKQRDSEPPGPIDAARAGFELGQEVKACIDACTRETVAVRGAECLGTASR